MSFALNIAACHRCDRRERLCAGKCPCLVNGRDIADNARDGTCPLGLFMPAGAKCTRCYSPAHVVADCPIAPEYEPTPANATAGGCNCADPPRTGDE